MDAPRLEAFVTVVEIQSFTRAAVRLNVSQPTITSRVRSLESELGTKLLDRRPKSLRLTAAGAKLLPLARDIIRLTRKAENVVQGDAVVPRGRISIGTPDCLTNSRLLPLIEYVYQRYPSLELLLHHQDTDDALDSIREGNSDCALFVDAMRDVGNLEHRVLCPEPLILLASPCHVLNGKARLSPEELRKSTWVQCDHGIGYHMQVIESLGTGGDFQPRTFVCDSVDAAKRIVANGVGLSVMPSVSARDELADGSLVQLPWHTPFEAYTQIAWHRDNTNTVAVDTLVDDLTRIIVEDDSNGGLNSAKHDKRP